MMHDFGLLFVQARVVADDRECTAQVPLARSWQEWPWDARQHAMRQARAMLRHEGALCARCAPAEAAVPSCATCGPVHMALLVGDRAYPLLDDAPGFLAANPLWRLLLFARATVEGWPYFVSVEVDAAAWARAEPEQWDAHSWCVVKELARRAGCEESELCDLRAFLRTGDSELLPLPTPRRTSPAGSGG